MIGRNMALLALAGLAAAGCDRSGERAAHKPAAKAQPEARPAAKPAPRSIMQPALVAPEPPPSPPAPTMVTIPFDQSGSSLDDAQRAILDPLATRLAGTGDSIVIRGNTDSHGSDRRNRLVSHRRARLVAAYLAGKGIAHDRMTVVALGEDRPIAPNANPDGSDDPAGRARNRRVEIEIVPAARSAPPPANKTDPVTR